MQQFSEQPSWIYLRRSSFEREPQTIQVLRRTGRAELEEGLSYHVDPTGGHSMAQVFLYETATHSDS